MQPLRAVMPVVVVGVVPAEAFALQHVLESVPDARFRVERIVESGDDAVMPLVRVRGGDRDAVEAGLAADPTVDEVTLLAAFDDELLFRMEWYDRVRLLVQMLTNARATILDAFGGDGRWQLRVLFPDHDAVSRTHEFCTTHGLAFDVASIRELEDEPAGRYGLTQDQYEALVLAVERGFFEVPRGITLEELADEAGVSHQALSERLRRGMGRLVDDTLLVESISEPR